MIKIRPLTEADYPEVRRIYKIGLDTGIASFETQTLDWLAWNQKYLKPCRLVAVIDKEVVGWVALTPFSKREVYKGVAELSLYISPQHKGQGIGSTLLKELIALSEEQGFWTLQAKIFPENKASIHLHKKLGFREVGFRQMIAQRDGKWYDNILLERRSPLL